MLSDRYAVERRLGSGSMGDVYLGEHTLMKKEVAIKVLHPEYVDNEEAVKRFQREAQAAAHIDHHNVCVATDFGETPEGNFFLVMEYLEGRPLSDIVAMGELEPTRAAHIARQIAAGLVRAHALGIVHRDLKPDNIMIVPRPEDPDFVKIMDFGVAKVQLGDAEKLTKAGVAYGTPAYMSPEQAMGRTVDGRSDLYALGIILYEMLTGAVPFFGTSVAVVMSAHADKPVPPMSEAAPDVVVPEAYENIVRRLLEKKPADRIQTAEELEEILRQLEDGDIDEAGDTLQPIPMGEAKPAVVAAATTEKEFAAMSTGGHATVDGPDLSDASLSTTIAAPGVPGVPAADPLAALPVEQAKEIWAGLPTVARIGAVAGVLGVLLLPVAIVLGIVSATSDNETSESAITFGEPSTLASERDDFAADETVGPAIASIASGNDLETSIETLQAEATRDPENAHAQYFLGLAHFAKDDLKSGAAAFAKAGELDPRYLEDEALLEAVFAKFDSKDEKGRDAVRAFIQKSLLGSAAGREALAAQAAEGSNYRVRRDARKMLEETGAKDKLERWRQVTVELRSTDDCGRLKKGVEELGELADPRGLPAVERIHRLPRKGCGFLKRGDCYECLRGTVRTVKKKLESAPPVEAKADAGSPSESEGSDDR